MYVAEYTSVPSVNMIALWGQKETIENSLSHTIIIKLPKIQ